MSRCDCDYWHSEHRWHCATNYPSCDDLSRVQAIEAAEDHADQTAFDAWRERGL